MSQGWMVSWVAESKRPTRALPPRRMCRKLLDLLLGRSLSKLWNVLWHFQNSETFLLLQILREDIGIGDEKGWQFQEKKETQFFPSPLCCGEGRVGEGHDLAAQNDFCTSTICCFKAGYAYFWLFKNHWTDRICWAKWVSIGRPLASTALRSWFVNWKGMPERLMKYSGGFGRATVCNAHTH